MEFLVSDNAPDEFFFMEMNTRLQVEHPVTEMVTGIDLVEWQVRIAAGEELTVRQDDVVLTGHSVEARVYAEVPEKNFLPSSGEVAAAGRSGRTHRVATGHHALTSADPDVRVDSALLEGLQISSNYDPMISKVIAWGQDRTEALDTLDGALAGYTALGIDTNVEYLRLLINDADVRAGRLDTGLIERKMPDFSFRRPGDFEIAAAALYAAATQEHDRRPPGRARGTRDGWRLGAPAAADQPGTPDGGVATVEVSGAVGQGTAAVTVDGGPQRTASLALPEPQPRRADPGRRSPGYSLVAGPRARSARSRGQPDAHGNFPRQRGLVLPPGGAHPGDPARPGAGRDRTRGRRR